MSPEFYIIIYYLIVFVCLSMIVSCLLHASLIQFKIIYYCINIIDQGVVYDLVCD